MKRHGTTRMWIGVACALLCMALIAVPGIAQEQTESFVIPEDLPELAVPILVTTCGQSPGALMVSLICNELGLACEEADLITADELAAQCREPETYGVLFVTTGTSLKGMGAAGVNVDSEVTRCLALIEKARELGMVIIVGQIEGPSRRTDEYDEKSIRAMSPLADLLITRSDVNEDGYFTTLAEEKGIPQLFIKKTIELRDLFPLIFPMPEEE